MNIVKTLIDRVQGKAPKGARRSSKWAKVRKSFKAENPICAVCGSRKKVEIHHKVPFHIAPDLELSTDNLISLCENRKYGVNCHLLVGHLGNYRRVNVVVEYDVMVWNKKLKG